MVKMLPILTISCLFCLVLASGKGRLDQQFRLQVEDDSDDINSVLTVPRTYDEIEINDAYYGRRNVTYFITSNGLAVIDGDVVYGTKEKLLANRFDPESPDPVRTEAFSVRVFWPGGRIRYKYDSDGTQLLLADVVPAAISRWQTAAPYLTFVKEPNSATPSNDIATISANMNDGCHSSIGFGDKPLMMNLQRISSTQCSCCTDQAVHEFGHLLGLNHEHQRPDRDNFVHYQCANLDPTCTTMPPGANCCTGRAGCCKFAGNFGIINDINHDAALQYDINSIMHYTRNAFAKAGTDTLTPANAGVVFPAPPTQPSALDIVRICKLYRDVCPRARNCASQGCPDPCVIRRPCNNSPRCRDEQPPECCFPDVDDCRAHKLQCTRMGCDFLK